MKDERGGPTRTKAFIWFAFLFVVLVVALLIIAVINGNAQIRAVKSAGGNAEPNLIQTFSQGLERNKIDEIKLINNPDKNGDGVIDFATNVDPNADDDGDGVRNIEDIDIDGNGILNSQEIMEIGGSCGDTNSDGILDLTDFNSMVDHVYINKTISESMDLNKDSYENEEDIKLFVLAMFKGESLPYCEGLK